MTEKLKVMLTTEGTYPFHQGGVSTWCDMLIRNLPDIDYTLYSIIMNPYVTQKFNLPENTNLIKVPLWGTEEPSEHLEKPFSLVYLSKKKTVDKVIEKKFLPLFNELITEILSLDKNPEKLGRTLFELHKYFEDYEYKASFKSEAVWELYKAKVLETAADPVNKLPLPDIFSMTQSIGWIYRFLIILNTPVPFVNVSHSAAAAFCGIPCVLAKFKYNTPFMLTEHGVYLREQYLSLAQRKYPSFLTTFLMRMVNSVTGLNYYFADQVSPVCDYNTRWEKKLGVNPEDIRVIYNGVDTNLFYPQMEAKRDKLRNIVLVARVDPIKDIETFIKAADLTVQKYPDVKFIIHGSVSVPEYYQKCLELVQTLNLSETVVFAGHTSDVPNAYRQGDIVVLSSISEAFPYSVVEAMMCGKPVVASDVGGIREALGHTGIVVNPRDPIGFSEAIVKLIEDPELAFTLGEEARERALNNFTINKVLSLHLKSYINMAAGGHRSVSLPSKNNNRQRLLYIRGEALFKLGYYLEAIQLLRQAISVEQDSPVVPVISTRIAEAYNSLGEYDQAFIELERGIG